MTTLLALDTATEACSVALLYNNKIYHSYKVIPRLHAQQLLPMVQEILTAANMTLSQVDALVFGRGPGAFTGVRIATGVIQGLAFALDKPVIAISDLALLAQKAWRDYRITKAAVAIDARMNEIYWGCYALQGELMCLVGTEQVLAPQQAKLPNDMSGQWSAVGTGWKYASQMAIDCTFVDAMLLPDARDLLTLGYAAWQKGETVTAELAEPIYLRDNVATAKI